MIDYHTLEAIIKPVVIDDSHKITNNDIITEELVQFLIKANQFKYINECFAKMDRPKKGELPRPTWHIQMKCTECDTIQEKLVNKATLLDYLKVRYSESKSPHNPFILRQYSQFLCNECIERQRIAEEEKKVLENQKILDNTKLFVQKYLSKDINTSMLRNNIDVLKSEIRNCDEGLIAEYISSLDYDHFLITPYWKIIAYHVKKSAKFKCVICGSNENLNAHHKDYSIHGYELQNIRELVCLCNSCHSLYHNNL